MQPNLKAEVFLEWGDGEYLFALKGKEIEELEHQCGKVGFGAIFQRISMGVWFWGDIYHSIRLGLIGGGMGAVEAKRLTDMYVGQNPIPLVGGPNNPESVALAVVSAAMTGVPDLPLGESQAGESPAKERPSQRTKRASSKTA